MTVYIVLGLSLFLLIVFLNRRTMSTGDYISSLIASVFLWPVIVASSLVYYIRAVGGSSEN